MVTQHMCSIAHNTANVYTTINAKLTFETHWTPTLCHPTVWATESFGTLLRPGGRFQLLIAVHNNFNKAGCNTFSFSFLFRLLVTGLCSMYAWIVLLLWLWFRLWFSRLLRKTCGDSTL